MILAGGLGTRLQTVIPDRQKVLAFAKGRPFLSHILDKLAVTGIERTILCVGYRSEQVANRFGNNYRSMEIVYSYEDAPLGTGGAVMNALHCINSEFVMVMNGDSLVDIDLSDYLDWFFKKGIDISICLTRVKDVSRYGKVEIDQQGLIRRFQEKSDTIEPGLINAGIYICHRSIFENFSSGKQSLELDIFPKLLGVMHGYITDGCFLDIGTPESYACVDDFIDSFGKLSSL